MQRYVSIEVDVINVIILYLFNNGHTVIKIKGVVYHPSFLGISTFGQMFFIF